MRSVGASRGRTVAGTDRDTRCAMQKATAFLLPTLIASSLPGSSCVSALDGAGGGGDVVQPGRFCTDAEPEATPSSDGRFAVTTEHYDLEIAADTAASAVDVARLAEAAWLAQQEHFGAAPTERLGATWYATRAEWESDLAASGAPPEAGAGGTYLPSTKRATLYTQPTRNYSTTLFLHELVHQFQFLARGDNRGSLDWYTEGIAEELGRHDWDGRCVRLGTLPLATLEDYPSQALATVQQGFDLAAIVSGASSSTRPVYQQIWHYLGTQAATASGLADFSAAVDADPTIDVAAAFAEHVGDPASVEAGFLAWLPTAQEPLTPVFLEWEHVDADTIRALPQGALTVAVVKDDVTHLTATAKDVPAGSQAGVVVGYDDGANYDAVLVDERGAVTLQAMRNNQATATALGTTSSSPPWTFDVTWSGNDAKVKINATSTTAALGTRAAGGLAAYNESALFDDVSF